MKTIQLLSFLLLGLAVLALTSCQIRQQNPLDAAIDEDVVLEIKSLRAER